MGKLFIIILWILLLPIYWWAGHSCCCKHADVTEGSAKISNHDPSLPLEKEEVPARMERHFPIEYLFSNDTAFTNDQTASYAKELAASINENQRLHITGLYSAKEANPTSFNDLGLARAYFAKIALSKYMDTTGITLGSRQVNTEGTPQDAYFRAAEFDARIYTETLQEIDDRTIIYFPYNSTDKLDDMVIEDYLDKVAERVNRTGEKVYLYGHTDSFGDATSNKRLGQARAEVIAAYLKRKGVANDQIITESRGEANPIAPNTTSNGRAKNRRTELIIK